MAAARTDIAPTETNPHLVFIPQKNQFKWNSDLNTLRDFWITELEGGDEDNLVSVNSNGHTEVLKFESVTVNFYASTKTLQVQGSQKDHYIKKLRSIAENGTKAQDTLIESTFNSGRAEITDPVLNVKPTSDHDDRYEKFEAFIKEQRDFNKKIESHIASNSVEISECTIELKDLEHKCKNQTKEVKLFCGNHIQAVKDEIGEEMQKLAKQIANLSSKLSSDLKTLKTKASSTEDSIKHILQQLSEIKNQLCISEESLISQLQETSHQEPALQQSTVIADSNEYTYAAATSNRYETLVEENRSIVESTPPNTQPNPASTTTSSPTATRTQPPISQPNDQPAFTSSSNQKHVPNPNERSPKGPVLLLGDSMIRGIQQRKFAPNRYVNKQIIAGGTREIRQYINHMQERNDYDYIVIHSGTNDVGNLTANEIRLNMENCLVNLKQRWPNSTIAISGLTYVPRDTNKNQLIDEINCHYESICTELGVTFIDNKRVTCDNYGNLIEQVFYDDVHLNNKIGTKKLVTNVKYHLGLNGRNFESLQLPRNRRVFARIPNGPQREQYYNERRRRNYYNNQPLQALNLIAEYLRDSEMMMR